MCANISQRPQIELRLFIEYGGTSYSGWPMKRSDAALTIVIFSTSHSEWQYSQPSVFSEAEGLSFRRATRMFIHAFEWNKYFFSKKSELMTVHFEFRLRLQSADTNKRLGLCVFFLTELVEPPY